MSGKKLSSSWPPDLSWDGAEQAVLGAVLLDGSALKQVVESLRPEAFDIGWHRAVYATMVKLHNAGSRVDVVTLTHALQKSGHWTPESEGYLVSAVEAVPSAAGVVDYAEIVREHARRRRIIGLAKEIETAAASGDGDDLADLARQLEPLLTVPRRGSAALVFRSVDELADAQSDGVEWLCRGLIAKGQFSLIVGKPKVGKSTLAFDLVGALENGVSFLERPAETVTAVYLSEEDSATIRQKATRFRVSQARFLQRRDAYPRRPLADVIGAAVEEALRVGAPLLVVDTLTMWAGLPADAEKDAGAMQAAADVLLGAAAKGLAVVAIHHSRKAPGEESDTVRGSNALPAAADIIITLARRPGEDRSQRTLSVLSRDEDCPPLSVVRLTETGHEMLGTEEEVKGKNLREAILDLVPEAPEKGATFAEIQKATKARREFVQKVLTDLQSEGLVTTTGRGKRGSPYRYQRPSVESCSHSLTLIRGTGTESPEEAGDDSIAAEDEQPSEPDSVPKCLLTRWGTGTESVSEGLDPVRWYGFSPELSALWDELWDRWQERAAVLEHDAGLAREEAERRARQEVAR